MERAILARLQHKVPHPNKLIYVYCILDGKDGLPVFLALEKVFELARREVIIQILASRGVSGKILS